jgi:hypothetical protein
MFRTHLPPREEFAMVLLRSRHWRARSEDFCLETATAGMKFSANFATR